MDIPTSMLLCLGLASCPAPAPGEAARAALPPAHIEVGAETGPPPGFVTFCMHNPRDCGETPDAGAGLVMRSGEKMAAMRKINLFINRSMPYRSSYARFGVVNLWGLHDLSEGGDCKDYALAKQRALEEGGFPRPALRLALVRTHISELHAVLTVTTVDGDFVLDNRTDEILAWHQTGYTWISLQSSGNPLAWKQVLAH